MTKLDEKPQGLNRDMVSIGHSDASPPVRTILDGIYPKLVGQDHAIKALEPALEIDCSKMRAYLRNELFGVYMFLGPPGVGKTELAYLFARNWIGDISFDFSGDPIEPLTLVDCTSFSDAHNVSKLSGGTPDYVGFGEETPLYQQKLDWYHRQALYTSYRDELLESKRFQKAGSHLYAREEDMISGMVEEHAPFKKVLLLDEVPEAHPTLHNYLLTLLNGKPLSFSDGEVTDVTRLATIMTGNVGMEEIRKVQKGGMGFQTVRDADPDVMNAKIKHAALKAYEKFFRPPFISRTRSGVIVFRFLTVKEFEGILDLQLGEITGIFELGYGKTYPGVKLAFTPEAKGLLLEKGVDLENGARRLKAVVRNEFFAALARLMNWQEHAPGVEKIKPGNTLVFEREGGRLAPYIQR